MYVENNFCRCLVKMCSAEGGSTILFNMLSISLVDSHLYIQYYEPSVPLTIMTLLVFSCSHVLQQCVPIVCLSV